MPKIYFKRKNPDNKIALTFDDGPSEETEKILDILKENDAKATFFIWGQRIKGREKTIKRIIREGNEIGNHSYSHKKLWFRKRKEIEEEIGKCDEELEELRIKTNLFRPPAIRMGINLLLVCNKMKKKIIICDVISNDWKEQDANKIINKVLKKTKSGSIVNFHDYIEGMGPNKNIVRVIQIIVPKLKEKYKLVTVSELLGGY
jgi:peptidoglycan/xylan/chitin deacetylase (PgdA/CDA1 family)